MEKNIDVWMVRRNLEEIPQFALPEGFEIRTYRPGDEDAWVWIHELADVWNVVTRESFDRNFGYDLEAMKDRGFFLDAPDGRTIGTTTAWYDEDFHGKTYGRIHWVAIVPEFQGRGLAKPLLSAAMNRLAQSHDRCYLSTATPRLPAIHLYLNYGFQPFLHAEKCQEGWEWVRENLPHPLLEQPFLRPADA
jgi:GNAT superfamily N-acetyltransferase